MALTKTKLKHLRTALEERKTEIEGDLGQMDDELRSIGREQDNERGGLGNHMAEDGSNLMEAERISTISADMRDVVSQITAAMERIDDGTYGQCQRCGQPINQERLEAFPYVAHCIECQTFLERQSALRSGR